MATLKTSQNLTRSQRLLTTKKTSASSSLKLRVQPFQFGPGVVDLESPIDAALFGVGLVGPDPDLGLQQREFADAAVAEALAGQAAQFAFRDGVRSTAVFRGVAELDALDVRPRWFGRERRVERPLGMRVEVVAHQRQLLATRVSCVQQVGHCDRPVDLGATRAVA